MSSHKRAGGLLVGVLPLLLVMGACTTAGDTDTTSTSTTTTVVSTTAAPSTTTTTSVTSSTAAVDPATVLTDALTAAGTNYRYVSTVGTDDQVIASVTGIVTADGFNAVVEAGDVPVEYRKTPSGEWVREADGEWLPLEEPAPATEPLGTFMTPLRIESMTSTGATTVIDAVYPGEALQAATPEIVVRINIEAGVPISITYLAVVGDTDVTVSTTISDIGTIDPIPDP